MNLLRRSRILSALHHESAMPEMTLSHIDQICHDIQRQDISYSHLMDELIDHVCCDVEYEMSQGLCFNDAYKKVKSKMGPRRLKEIQEETLYAIDSKYRFMKNIMKISGIAGTTLLGFAAILKIQHLPGSSVLLTLGGLILAFIFLPSSLAVLWKETHNKKRVMLFISAFLAGTFFILSTLFKIQHWPGANWLLVIAAVSGIIFFIPALLVSSIAEKENKSKRPLYILGALSVIFYGTGIFFKIQHWPFATILLVSSVILFSVVVLPWYTWVTWKEETNVNATFLFVLIGSLLIVVPGAMINLNLQNSYDYGYFSNVEQQQAIYKYAWNNNISVMNRYRDSVQYPKLEQLHSQTKNLINSIGTLQTKMVAESEGKPGSPALNPEQITQTEAGMMIQYNMLSKPFQRDAVKDLLLPACKERKELEKSLSEYGDLLAGIEAGSDIRKYRDLLEPSIYLPGETGNPGYSMISGLFSLELLKNSILTIESNMLAGIVNK